MVTATETGSSFAPVPEGGYTVTCIRIIDFGTQKTEYKGETKFQHKVLIVWEVPEVMAEDKDGNPMPALIFKTYTVSLHEKAVLRKDLEAWRGKKFTAEELQGFDLGKLLGKSCLMQVVHNESGGNIYANVQAIMALPKGTASPTPQHPLINFDLDDYSEGMFGLLSEKLQDRIRLSPEYQRAIGHTNGGGGGEGFTESFSRDMDDEIPFIRAWSLL